MQVSEAAQLMKDFGEVASRPSNHRSDKKRKGEAKADSREIGKGILNFLARRQFGIVLNRINSSQRSLSERRLENGWARSTRTENLVMAL
jgi:hypothetical protein